MDLLTRPSIREIIDDFASEIKQRRRAGPKPEMSVIFFRNEQQDGVQRPIFYVPTELLRFRKDNGRIASDVETYESHAAALVETSVKAQGVLRGFLENKDPEKTQELMNSISHSGQIDPAIVTSDGFLINGNRRKLATEKLFEKTKDDKYLTMKVVILPGKNEDGGPPTLLEIEQIENRYQLQSQGKAEYYGFDRALSIRRKMKIGMSLEKQLRDDPNYAHLSEKEFIKVIKKYQEEYVEPLKCVDAYLKYFGRDGLYSNISSSVSDREGKWQAFLDYYKSVEKKLLDESKRLELGVKDEEVGIIRGVAFKMIRHREFTDLPKIHALMRELPKFLENKEAKKRILDLAKIEATLKKEEISRDGVDLDEKEQDRVWSAKHKTELMRCVREAKRVSDYSEEKEEPLGLLESAYRKISHENVAILKNRDTFDLRLEDIPRALELVQKIGENAQQLESMLWNIREENKKAIGSLLKPKIVNG